MRKDDSCPRCHTDVASNAMECPKCGLTLKIANKQSPKLLKGRIQNW